MVQLHLLSCDAGLSPVLRTPDLGGRSEAQEVTDRTQRLPDPAQGQGRGALQDHLHIVGVGLVSSGGTVPVIPNTIVRCACSHQQMMQFFRQKS